MTAVLDMTLHPPVRLQIAAVLAKVTEAEFSTLRQITGVTDSVLSKHLSALTEQGYVKLRKASVEGRRCTWASLTATGNRAFAGHIAALQDLAAGALVPAAS